MIAQNKKPLIWQIKNGKELVLAEKALLMGIINATPDSFSDGGAAATAEKALRRAQAMLAAGADILDIGGQSTHPQAALIDAAEESRRLLPVIGALAAQFPDLPLSVDTYRASTAAAACRAGAHIINDIFGLQGDAAMAELVAETGAGLVLMHTGRAWPGREGQSAAWRQRVKHKDALEDQRLFFSRSLEIAAKAGIKERQIVLDPGFGFAKTEAENLALLRHAEALQCFGLPLLAGTSRKGFLGKISGMAEPQERDAATAASSVILRLKGFALFRVHNIGLNREALAVADAVRRRS